MQLVSRNIAVLVPILYIKFITHKEHRQNEHTTATCAVDTSSLFV